MNRALAHPPMSSVTLAGILHALADPVRLRIVRELAACEQGLSCTQTAARLKLATPKSTCSLHYRILREAGLLKCERHGTELTSRVRLAELEARFPGLLHSILESYDREARAGESRARRGLGQAAR
jgi:DNA-binding transcriptional ArsR family regulator